EAPGESEAEIARDTFIGSDGRERADVVSGLSTADPTTRSRIISRLQQERGNAYVQRIVAEVHSSHHVTLSRSASILQRQQPPTAAASGVSPALLHQVGLQAINTYREAAVRGIDLFVRDMSGPFNWTAFWGGVVGNVIWAAACFETGGTAF